MGIAGLLPFVRKAWRDASLAEFEGATVAVDIYCWIHKGAFACAESLALNKPTNQFVAYCLRLVKLLLRFKIKPILVFDGHRLPAKADTETKRRENRENLRQRAARLLASGRKSEARECFERSVSVTQEMAQRVLQAARELGVDCLVAPYESDAQLACLCRPGGIADMALTEDSDLLAFGCERVFFKLDLNAGRGIVIERERLLQETGLSADRFRHMCLLAGCDYHPGIQGVGLTTAARVMTRTRLGDFMSLLTKLRMYLPRLEGALLSPQEIEALMRAERTFLHQAFLRQPLSTHILRTNLKTRNTQRASLLPQVVFDPLQLRQRPLTPYPPDRPHTEFYFAGQPEPDDRIALQLALGNLDFDTKATIGSYDPNRGSPKHMEEQQRLPQHLVSIFHPRYRPRPPEHRVYKVGSGEELPQGTPEALTGREKEVTVPYHMPALPSGDVRDPVESLSQYFPNQGRIERTQTERTKEQLAREEKQKEKEAKEILSQYYVPEVENRGQEQGEQQENEATKENSPPTSPVFNYVSSNRFATSLSPPSKRTRFSLDEGCCSPPWPTAAAAAGGGGAGGGAPSPQMVLKEAPTFLHALHSPDELETFQAPPQKSPSQRSFHAATSPTFAASPGLSKARTPGPKSKKDANRPSKAASSFFANFKKTEKNKLQIG